VRVRSNTLREMWAYVQATVYAWDGDITVEILPTCPMNTEEQQDRLACWAADLEVRDWLLVKEWTVLRVGNLVVLTPKTWEDLR
jgi:hypothetical protein